MPLAGLVQRLIHAFEVGPASRVLRVTMLGLVVAMLALLYDVRAYQNLSAPEAMDAAQLARNISEGKGYTTLFIRPFSLYLVQNHNQMQLAGAVANTNLDLAQIKTAHPDLANPPFYPVLLAGWMKILPFKYAPNLKNSFWNDAGKYSRYEPDFLIAVLNEILLLIVVALTFFIARKLFDQQVAWLSAILVLGCELLWRFSVSGLSTMLVLVIFLVLAWCILQIEIMARERESSANNRLPVLAAGAGALAAAGALTRYSFGWVIIPVILFLVFFSGPRRIQNVLAALGAFLIFLAPWVVRNFAVSGEPFGTAGFAAMEGTFVFPEFHLERSLQPDLALAHRLTPYTHKFFTNGCAIFQDDMIKLGGGWAAILFWAGLLLNFRGPAVRRMRYFLLMCLGTFIFSQALGQTQLSEETPVVNSENLLVLLVPLVFIYASGFFSTLLEQMNLPLPQLRYAVAGAFVGVCCLPMIFALASAKAYEVVRPQYCPADIQQTAAWMKENELMMSDVPWAVAWYGRRQCAWLTLNARDDFAAIDKNMKPIQAVYLTPETMDGKFLSDWVYAGKNSWGDFVLQAVTETRIPTGFPLQHAPSGFMPERLFLTDRRRWEVAP
jgi:hypothetical protein